MVYDWAFYVLLGLCILGAIGMVVAWGIVAWEQIRWDWRTRDAPWRKWRDR